MRGQHRLSRADRDLQIERAAITIAAADHLLITAGAGMGVDSGLPDYRGPEGFWNAHPPLRDRRLRWIDLANPEAFERKNGRINPWVFHRDGRPIKCFRGAWQTACRKSGLEDRLVHDLRRTAVRNLERAGVSRSVAMKLTGHKTEAVYRRYAIVSESDLGDGVKKLESLLRTDLSEPRKILPYRARSVS